MTDSERRREKLRNAVLFFVRNDKTVGLTKLMKLLFYLDFRLYRMVGESLTGETYEAWKHGPVPSDVWRELRLNKDAGLKLNEVVKVIPVQEDPRDEASGVKLAAMPKAKFSDEYFTGREVKELRAISEIFSKVPANLVVEASHAKNTPWDRTMKTRGEWAKIDYSLALEGCDENQKAYIREIRDDLRILNAVMGQA
ncbi:MAG: SocA family protein [Deltaproteobacteria bacterium]|jgi:uncharacterized phage-associated protein|nr:SocA family protein [Deltaproteobacteria bacterium]